MRFHEIERIEFSGATMLIRVDGRQVGIDLGKVSPRLAAATSAQRSHYEVSPSGYGIHWPELDEDLSIDGLLGIKHAPGNRFFESVAEDPPPES